VEKMDPGAATDRIQPLVVGGEVAERRVCVRCGREALGEGRKSPRREASGIRR